jgi:hypothetical protein
MIDYKKLRKEFTKVLNSYSEEELLEWVDSYHQRMALAELEDESSQPVLQPSMVKDTSRTVTKKPRKISVRRKKETVG